MRLELQNRVKKYIDGRKKRRRSYAALGVFSVAVLCVTLAVLSGTAVTQTAEPVCGYTEHQHTDACYSRQCCCAALVNIHVHTPECYDENGMLVCGKADFVLHTHDQDCYDAYGNLICNLPEIKAGELISANPYIKNAASYGNAIAEAHVHDASCYDSEGNLICGKFETYEHVHTDLCFSTMLICDLPEHIHTEDCYPRETTTMLEELIVPETTAPETTAPETTAPETTAPETTAPETTTPETTAPETTAPETTAPETTAPETTAPETTAPETTAPETTAPETTAPETTAPETTAPETTAPETTAPETTAPETTAPETTAPETTAPETTAPETTAPETTAPETTAPETTAPETTAPETTAPETTAPETEAPNIIIDTNLPIMGNAYAQSEDYPAAMMFSMMTAYSTPAPVDVSNYVTNIYIAYLSGTQWISAVEATDIPADATYRITVDYDKVPIADIIAAEYKLAFTLPEPFKNAEATGKIMNGGVEIGEIVASGGSAVITFTNTWVDNEQENGNTFLGGDFYVTAQVDWTKLEEDGKIQIIIGDVTIDLDFENGAAGKYSTVNLTKELTSGTETERLVKAADGSYYLTYNLTVTAPTDGNSASGIDNIVVTDSFTSPKYIDSYSVSADDETSTVTDFTHGTVAAADKTLTWTIGHLAQGETRTLAYTVKVDPCYTGVVVLGSLINNATVKSGGTTYDTAKVTYSPKSGAEIVKSAKLTPNAEGGATIDYTITVKAKDNNSYVLRNLKVYDLFANDYKSYLTYDLAGLKVTLNGTVVQASYSTTDTSRKYFDLFIGDLAPGETKIITYTVKVDDSIQALGKSSYKISNTAGVYSDGDASEGGNEKFASAQKSLTLSTKKWSRKIVGSKIETALDVPTGTNTFTVPAGSYKYNVIVNEAGDWNLSSTTFNDKLNGSYIKYKGYLRVDAYTISTLETFSNNAAALASFAGKTPAETKWVDINDSTTFSFTPASLGFTNTNYAYLLTYYALPVVPAGVTTTIKNDFKVSGEVGLGDQTLTIPGITVSANVQIVSESSFAAVKSAWYYDSAKTDAYPNGTLYWIIKLSGTIPEGLKIKDTRTSNGTYSDQALKEMTVYVSDTDLTACESIDALPPTGCTPLISGTDYLTDNDTANKILTFKNSQTLTGNQAVYIVVKSSPSALPTSSVRDQKSYQNYFTISTDGGNTWSAGNYAEQYISTSASIFKETGGAFTYDGSLWKTITAGIHNDASHITKSAITAPGTYIEWLIHVNWDGTMEGLATVTDTIPEGLELAYVRYYWKASGASAATVTEIENIGTGWTQSTFTANADPGSGVSLNCISYYNSTSRQAMWRVSGLTTSTGFDKSAVEFQIVCRVIDDTLLSGEGKTFVNTATVTSDTGATDTGSSSITLSRKTISKTGNYSAENGSSYPFVITVNELGEDLTTGDKVTIVDKIGEKLTFEPSSLKITKADGTALGSSDYTLGYTSEADTFELQVPDNLKLTINYTCKINAAPGEAVNIKNDAYWKGYTSTSGGHYEEASFVYTVGGSASADTNPSLKIVKSDSSDASSKLAGAVFIVQEAVYDETNGFTLVTDTEHEGTTNVNGELLFSGADETGSWLKYNTIYCVWEKTAPAGYMLDSSKSYYAAAKSTEKDASGNPIYQKFPKGVEVNYSSPLISLEITNSKGEINIDKTFVKSDGTTQTTIDGSYKFGLFLENETTPKQTITVTFKNGIITSGEAKFKNVDAGATYYIYELDASGNKITNNSNGIIDGMSFKVSYPDGNSATFANTAAEFPTVKIQNSEISVSLPKTGGGGTAVFTLLGLSAMALAFFGLFDKRKKF